MFIDVHCHLNLLTDIEKVANRAHKKNVEIMVTQGVDHETNKISLDLADDFTDIKAALGLYPIEGIKMNDKQIKELRDFIRKNKNDVSAIGEVGLDLKEDTEHFDKQQKNFQMMIDLSKELGKPIIVHSRKAELQCIEQLEKSGAKKVIMHCFCGKMSLVKRIIENGWSLSIPTSVKNSQQFQEIVKLAPLTQLFAETDSPYLHPDREFPNTPENVIVSYEMIAKVKGISVKEVEKQIERNYHKLFDN